jgi:hypothetical protein
MCGGGRGGAERLAGRAQARGRPAAAFLERSVELTVDPARRTERATTAGFPYGFPKRSQETR